MTKKLNAVS